MELLLNRFRNLTVLLVVILAQVVLLAYQVKSGQDVRLIRVWSVTAVTPLAKVLEVVRRYTIGLAEDYFVLINIREQNSRLTEELGRLKMENQFLKTELQTADRARALQVFQARTPSRTLAARIIGTGTGTNSRVVFVDQGSRAGVMRGMAVVTPDGIVGKVLAAYPIASQVLLITDPTFAAGVISDKNRVHGTLKGLGQSKCLVDYVQNEEKVEVGEMFYTSGDDRVFPKGTPAGRVSVVRQGKTFKEIYVVPSGFQYGLEEVLIVVEGVHQSIPETPSEAAPGVYVLPAPPAASGPVSSTGATPRTTPGAAPGATPGATPGANPAPAAESASTPAGTSSAVMTDADRLRQRYKKIGEAQNHVFGTGLPGSRPPNFNINPDAPKPKAPATPPPVTSVETDPATSPVTPPVTPPKPKPKPVTPAEPKPPPDPEIPGV